MHIPSVSIPKLGLYLYSVAVEDIAESLGFGDGPKTSLLLTMAGAIRSGELKSRDPAIGAVYLEITTNPPPYVTVADVNNWLSTNGFTYRWTPPGHVVDGIASPSAEKREPTPTEQPQPNGDTDKKQVAARALALDESQKDSNGEAKSATQSSLTGQPQPTGTPVDESSTTENPNLGGLSEQGQGHPENISEDQALEASASNAAAINIGKSKGSILRIDWPGNCNLDRLLSDVPQWLESARIMRGKAGRNGSARWNPALIGACLHTKKNVPKYALGRHIKTYFWDYFKEWEEACEYLK